MVQSGGLEPPAFGATSRRSNQLSYDCTIEAMFNAFAFLLQEKIDRISTRLFKLWHLIYQQKIRCLCKICDNHL